MAPRAQAGPGPVLYCCNAEALHVVFYVIHRFIEPETLTKQQESNASFHLPAEGLKSEVLIAKS